MNMEHFTTEQITAIKSLHSKLQHSVMTQRETLDPCQPGRSEFERDSARVMYSASFRRLSGKMQILGIEATEAHRNRMTHSLEVSRIARSIARFINCKCGNVIYNEDEFCLLDAASFAHDIGHPAFGHKGERVLNEFADKNGLRFEGNAQNYRVVRKLDQHSLIGNGLNLTFRTLLAINKYVTSERERDSDNKPVEKFMYDEDYKFLGEIRERCGIGNSPTLDAQIVELADDIAYAVHDLEDGLRYNILNLDDLKHDIKYYEYPDKRFSKEDILEAYNLFDGLITEIKREFEKTTKHINTTQEYNHIFRKTLSSKLTHEFVWSIDFKNGKLVLGNPQRSLCKTLSKIIFNNVIRNTGIALHEIKGEHIIKTLLNIYSNPKINKGFYLLPPDYRTFALNDETALAQSVIDYVSGMMDDFAAYEFERLTGVSYDNINVTNVPKVKRIQPKSLISQVFSNINRYIGK